MVGGVTFKVAAIFQAFDKMSGPLRNINSRVNKFTKGMAAARIGTKKSSVGMLGSFKQIATGVIGASAAFFVWDRLLIGTIRRGAELEATLVSAGAKFGKIANVIPGTAQFKRFEAAALKAGLTTEFTANQSALAMKNLAAAGLTLGQSIKTLPIVADFATASGLGIERAAEISTKAIGAFGGNIKDLNPAQLRAKMSEINNILVVTANSFSTTVEEIFEASVGGGRVLTRLIGASGFQFASLIGNIAQGGIVAEKAGRGIRAAFLKLTSKEGAKGLKKLGISLTDQNGKFKDIISIISELRVGLGGVKDEAKRLALGNVLFGRVGLVQMDLLLGKTDASLRKNAAAMRAQRGEVARIAKLIRGTLSGAWIKFISLMEGLSLIIFTKVKPALKFIVDVLSFNATAIAKNSGRLLGMIGLIAKVILAVKFFTLAQWLFNAAIKANPLAVFITALLVLTTIFPGLADKVLIYSEAIVILTAGIFLLTKSMAIAKVATVIWGAITVTFTAVIWLMQIAIMVLASSTTLVTIAMVAWNSVAIVATAATTVLGAAFTFLLSPLGLIMIAVGLLIFFWDDLVDLFSRGFGNVLAWIKPFTDFIGWLGSSFMKGITSIIGGIGGMFSNVFGAIGEFFGFGGDDLDADLEKNTNLNVNNRGGEITPSPAVVASARIQNAIDIRFHDKPDNVDVTDTFDDNDGLILLGTG